MVLRISPRSCGLRVTIAVTVVVASPDLMLLERDVELGYLSGRLDEACAGRGGVVVVEGPAGIGKSALLRAVSRLAGERGFTVLGARAADLEAGMAFGVARQLLEPALFGAQGVGRRRLLAGPARLGASALGVEGGDPPADEFGAVHGLYWLCANLAEQEPLLVAVDDVQWSDAASLAWLSYLGRRAGELAMLVALAVREGDRVADRRLLAALVADPRAGRLRLSPLDEPGVAAVVGAELGAGASADFCSVFHELTGGNPLYVRQLAAAARRQELTGAQAEIGALRTLAGAAVGESVLTRLVELGPDADALAGALAVLGSGTEVAVAAELARLQPGVAELTADALAAAQIFAARRPLEFFHPVIGEAVRSGLPPGARRVAHRRAASIIDRRGGVDRVAVHLLESAPSGDRWVVERLAAATHSAVERGAPDVAASYLRRALAEPPAARERPALLLGLGEAEWRSAHPDAIDHLTEALEAAHDAGTIAATARALANAYYVTDRTDLSVRVLQDAIARLVNTDTRLAFSLECSCAQLGVLDDRTAPAALPTLEQLSARMHEFGAPPVTLLAALANVAVRRQRPDDAERLINQVLASEPYPPPIDVAPLIIRTLIALERHDTLRRLCEDLMSTARRRSAIHGAVGIASFSAWAMYRRGELADAEAQARWALERGTGRWAQVAVAQLIESLIERDALDQAETALEQVPDPATSHAITVTVFLFARGRLHAAQGRTQRALRDFLECGERSARLGSASVLYQWRSAAGLALAALGQRHEARRLADEEVKLTRAFGRPGALGAALRGQGLVEGGERGLQLLGEAVRVFERAEAPVELARALADHGAALRRAGRRVAARAQLERALDVAHHWGARRIASSARAELVAAGAKPRRDAITGRDALTAGELRVARLAADGMTNREIAQALFITTKTASSHLTHVYRKLGITRRGQLNEALAGRLSAPE